MADPKFGDFVWVYWYLSTQYGTAGKVSGHEYTPQLEGMLEAGYGALTDRPVNPNRPPDNPNGAISRIDAERLITEIGDERYLTEEDADATYVRGSAAVFQGSEPPDLSALPVGTEYMWWQTDGDGNILDLLSGVKA